MMSDTWSREYDLAAWIKSVEDRVDAIQAEDSQRVTYFLHDPTGLGAQVSRRVLALRIAMLTGRRSVFSNESMYPYVTCYEPLSKCNIDDCADNVDTEMAFTNYEGGVSFDFWRFWEDEEMKLKVYGYIPDGIIDDKGAQILFEGILVSRMKLKDEFQRYVSDSISRLGINGDYIGLHYRRGDKKVETPYVSTEQYRNAVIALARSTGISTVFVASDSPRAVDELNLSAEGLNVVFDYSEVRLNNANHRYLMRNQDKALQETMTAIKNMYILAGAKKIVGQTNAHFATIAAGLISWRDVTLDPGILIPGEIQLRSPLISAKYKLKNAVKTLIKSMFPSLTIKSRRKSRV